MYVHTHTEEEVTAMYMYVGHCMDIFQTFSFSRCLNQISAHTYVHTCIHVHVHVHNPSLWTILIGKEGGREAERE